MKVNPLDGRKPCGYPDVIAAPGSRLTINVEPAAAPGCLPTAASTPKDKSPEQACQGSDRQGKCWIGTALGISHGLFDIGGQHGPTSVLSPTYLGGSFSHYKCLMANIHAYSTIYLG